uniref:Uncharacterized protein n=1 Tax=Arundo donax TaxID=35708 RepID=A0A0A8XVK7_ARUDO
MGQYNMLEMCTAKLDVLGRLAGMLGFNMRAVVPDGLRDLVVIYIQHMIKSGYVNTLGVVREKWGMEALQRWEKDHDVTIDKWFLGAELHEGIIMWHIATDVFLSQKDKIQGAENEQLVKEVRYYPTT